MTTVKLTDGDTLDTASLSWAQRRVLMDELFSTEMKRKLRAIDSAASSVEPAAGDIVDAAQALADDEFERQGIAEREQLLDALHFWHDAYHGGAFRLCREPQCRDLGWGTSGPAPLTLIAVAS